jgi:hypothetical protein
MPATLPASRLPTPHAPAALPFLLPFNCLPARLSCLPLPAVEEKQRFTLYWLECSLQAGTPLPPNRGAPLYQPLPFPLPMPSMLDVV